MPELGWEDRLCPSALLLGGEPGASSQKNTLVIFVIHTCYVPAILHLHTEPRGILTDIMKMFLAVILWAESRGDPEIRH